MQDCIHLGRPLEPAGQRTDATGEACNCRGKWLHGCDLHQQCTIGEARNGVAFCATCPDHSEHDHVAATAGAMAAMAAVPMAAGPASIPSVNAAGQVISDNTGRPCADPCGNPNPLPACICSDALWRCCPSASVPDQLCVTINANINLTQTVLGGGVTPPSLFGLTPGGTFTASGTITKQTFGFSYSWQSTSSLAITANPPLANSPQENISINSAQWACQLAIPGVYEVQFITNSYGANIIIGWPNELPTIPDYVTDCGANPFGAVYRNIPVYVRGTGNTTLGQYLIGTCNVVITSNLSACSTPLPSPPPPAPLPPTSTKPTTKFLQMTMPGLSFTSTQGNTLNLASTAVTLSPTLPLAWGFGMYPSNISQSSLCLGASASTKPFGLSTITPGVAATFTPGAPTNNYCASIMTTPNAPAFNSSSIQTLWPFDGMWAGVFESAQLDNWAQTFDWEGTSIYYYNPSNPAIGTKGLAYPGKMAWAVILLCYKGYWYFYLYHLINPPFFASDPAPTLNFNIPGGGGLYNPGPISVPPSYVTTLLMSICSSPGAGGYWGGIPITCGNLPNVSESWGFSTSNQTGLLVSPIMPFTGQNLTIIISYPPIGQTVFNYPTPQQQWETELPSTDFARAFSSVSGSVNLSPGVGDNLTCGSCGWNRQYMVSIPSSGQHQLAGFTYVLTKDPADCSWSTNNDFASSNFVYQESTNPFSLPGLYSFKVHKDFVVGGGAATVQMQINGGVATVSLISSISGTLATWTGPITPFGGLLTLNPSSLSAALANSVFPGPTGGQLDLRPVFTAKNIITVAAC